MFLLEVRNNIIICITYYLFTSTVQFKLKLYLIHEDCTVFIINLPVQDQLKIATFKRFAVTNVYGHYNVQVSQRFESLDTR